MINPKDLTQDQLDYVTDNCRGATDSELEDEFEDKTNDNEKPVEFMGLTAPAGSLLRDWDPVAFRECFNNWLDGQDLVEIDGEYYQGRDVEAALEDFADEAEIQAEAEEVPKP
jgi:hypothetical protein